MRVFFLIMLGSFVIATNSNAQDAIKIARSTKVTSDSTTASQKTSPVVGQKPEVVLSQHHLESCRLKCGDSIPKTQVSDCFGKTHELSDLLSDRLTVLLFWTPNSIAARDQFQRIPLDLLGKFAAQRVKVIAVNVGGDKRETIKWTGDAADKITSLVDEKRQLFEKFASSKVPRTYLLSATGEILWFDIEYSFGMQRELSSAISYYLQH